MVLSGLVLSFQRFLHAQALLAPGELPSSLGALPVGRCSDGCFALPVAGGEAFWIGLQMDVGVSGPVTLRLSVEHGTTVTELPAIDVPPALRVAGYPLPDQSLGLAVFARPPCRRLSLRVAAVHAELLMLAPADFALQTGLPAPPPADTTAVYGGWRLP